jgi:hypothetical protein
MRKVTTKGGEPALKNLFLTRNWKTTVAIASVFLVLVTTSSAQEWKEWTRGGTLHHATAAQWRGATYSNRLATSADFVASTEHPKSMEEFKFKAEQMETCISGAVVDPKVEVATITDVAAPCALLLWRSS